MCCSEYFHIKFLIQSIEKLQMPNSDKYVLKYTSNKYLKQIGQTKLKI